MTLLYTVEETPKLTAKTIFGYISTFTDRSPACLLILKIKLKIKLKNFFISNQSFAVY